MSLDLPSTMPALSVKQPYASLMFEINPDTGRPWKWIETRGYMTKQRGLVAICSSATRMSRPDPPVCSGSGQFGAIAQGCTDICPWCGRSVRGAGGRLTKHRDRSLATWVGDMGGPEDGMTFPLGVVLGVVEITDSLRVSEHWSAAHLAATREHRGRALQPRSARTFGGERDGLWIVSSDGGRGEVDGYAEDQLPFGDFTEGRVGWLCENARPLPEPVPAKGRLGFWNWTPPVDV